MNINALWGKEFNENLNVSLYMRIFHLNRATLTCFMYFFYLSVPCRTDYDDINLRRIVLDINDVPVNCMNELTAELDRLY